ncbi:MAG: hypothetical protein AAGH53_13095 [Pseudomonadota bacterium]
MIAYSDLMRFLSARTAWHYAARTIAVTALGSAMMLAANPAWAQTSCGANNLYTLDWDNESTGPTGTGTQNYTATSLAGNSQTVRLSYNGDTADLGTINFGGSAGTITTPYIGVVNTGGIGATEQTLSIGAIFDSFQSNIDSSNDAVGIRLTFAEPVREAFFTILDIDLAAGQFRDWVQITGFNGATAVTPRIDSPFGRNNQTNPGQTAPGTAFIGPFTGAASFDDRSVVGNSGASDNDQNLGNIAVTFSQAVTSIEIRYANGPAAFSSGTPGQQAIALHDINYCTFPNLSVTKVSASFETSGVNRFRLPQTDVIYTINVTNEGGSRVDSGSATVIDTLPPNVTFFNGDFNGGATGSDNFAFTPGASGLTLNAGNVSYSNDGGATFNYTPIAGYDPAVDAIRFVPQGAMEGDSNFSIQFRARIE